MSENQSTWAGLWNELQRRHVVRVTLGYAAVAFVVLQMGEIILPAFTDDPVLMQILVVVAALLFPVVIMLAWVYEVTPQGIRRMAEIDDEAGHVGNLMPVFPRLALLAVTVAVVGVTGWWAVNTGLQGARGDGAAEGSDRFPAAFALATYDPGEPIRSLAVLALDNFSADGEQDFFSSSLHEAIVSQLSQLPSVRVVSRTSALRYAGTSASVPQIGSELGVDALVEGSVTRVGDAVRVTVRLIHAASDTEIWTQQYDGQLDDILTLQREISTAIATAIQGELLPEERQAMMAYRDVSDDMEANEAMTKGRTAASGGTQSDLMEADEYFDDVIAIDPAFAPAYAEQARVQLELGMLEEDTTVFMQHLPRAVQLAERAMTLDAESPQVREVWHFVQKLTEGMEGVRIEVPEVSSAGAAIPAPEGVQSSVTVSGDSNVLVLRMGELSDSLSQVIAVAGTEMGRRLETRFGEWATRSAWNGQGRSGEAEIHAAESMAREGRPQDALRLLKKVQRMSPEFAEGWEAAERILASEERYDDVIALRWERAEALSEDAVSLYDLQAEVDDEGADGYWGWKFEEMSDLMEDGGEVSHVDFAIAYLQMGDAEGALDHLEVAARQHDERLVRERNNPAFDELRSDPRFRRLMARLSRPMEPRRGPRGEGAPGNGRPRNRGF